MKEERHNIQSSVLDRLIDEEPGVSHEPAQRRVMNLEQGRAAVIRDLENLLNTKRNITPIAPAYKEVGNSLLVYGIKDFTSQSPQSIMGKQKLRHDVAETIARFEPRLKNVTVQMEKARESERSIRFRINALLVLDPFTEPVTFDTLFDTNSGVYTIQR